MTQVQLKNIDCFKGLTFDVINDSRYYSMIESFACEDTQDLFTGDRVARFVNIQTTAIRKLQQLHAAQTLSFLRKPPGNRLEPLQGDLKGYTVFVLMTNGA